jgi:hypothetical protein
VGGVLGGLLVVVIVGFAAWHLCCASKNDDEPKFATRSALTKNPKVVVVQNPAFNATHGGSGNNSPTPAPASEPQYMVASRRQSELYESGDVLGANGVFGFVGTASARKSYDPNGPTYDTTMAIAGNISNTDEASSAYATIAGDFPNANEASGALSSSGYATIAGDFPNAFPNANNNAYAEIAGSLYSSSDDDDVEV